MAQNPACGNTAASSWRRLSTLAHTHTHTTAEPTVIGRIPNLPSHESTH